jgi:hypothetical protein
MVTYIIQGGQSHVAKPLIIVVPTAQDIWEFIQRDAMTGPSGLLSKYLGRKKWPTVWSPRLTSALPWSLACTVSAIAKLWCLSVSKVSLGPSNWDQFNSSAGRVELVEKQFGWAATGQLPDSQCHSAWVHQRLGWGLSGHGILLAVGQWLQAVQHSTTIGVMGLLGVGMIFKILLILGYSSVPDLTKFQFSSRISNYIIDRYFS